MVQRNLGHRAVSGEVRVRAVFYGLYLVASALSKLPSALSLEVMHHPRRACVTYIPALIGSGSRVCRGRLPEGRHRSGGRLRWRVVDVSREYQAAAGEQACCENG